MENAFSAPSLSTVKGLTFEGGAGYRIDGQRVSININAIHNHRINNTSGTLAIELWALPSPYQGGDFNGTPLAGTQIGEMLGQHFLQYCQYDLIFQSPKVGTWTLCLMLREWDGQGFVTRDFINFDLPYVVEAPARPKVAVKHQENSNVITVDFVDRVAESLSFVSTKKVKRTESVTDQKKVNAESVAKQDSTFNTQPVSVNTASLSDLEKLKGVSKNIAKGIEAGRPYEKLNDLLKVKGIGKKVLEKLAKQIIL